ncbi:class I SAM-dependent methyltransferase [Streptomyces sp. NPDC007088]|uniref:class I SAM-dependent methyltransferase n=1 Tax=Streptomyces sp. NPDC007088 TaxID=3364773 RepID=UPI00368CE8A8
MAEPTPTPARTPAPPPAPTPATSSSRAFESLVAEADAAPVDGWDFSWFEGRATEARPSWGYARLMGERLARAGTSLDLETGGGEVLASAPAVPPRAVATESWPPNLARAAARLHPLGVTVVGTSGDRHALPFADGAFDLVTSRHPVSTDWTEIARLLAPGGTYFSQQVGPASAFEVVEFFLGPQPARVREARDPGVARREAEAAGLEVVELRSERLRMEFSDVGAVVYFLRKVVWMVPGFTVERYRSRLRDMHELIEREGPFVAYSARFLIEARKPHV